MAGVNTTNALSAYANQMDVAKVDKVAEVKENSGTSGQTTQYGLGKTIGEPKLSDAASKYYAQLKKKFGNYDFILVSASEKDNVRANAGKYANGMKTVVLIDEEKIEKMATDSKFRKQYESILSGASASIEQIKNAAAKAGASLQGIVMQVNDDGTTSLFAALKKSSAEQKVRIEKRALQKKLEKKEADKKAAKKEAEERLKKASESKAAETSSDEDDIVTIMADSVESLIQKIEEYGFMERSNNVRTKEEKQIGQNIDFRG